MKTWPIIRHVRFVVSVIRYVIWFELVGRFIGIGPADSDIEYLQGIRDGKW